MVIDIIKYLFLLSVLEIIKFEENKILIIIELILKQYFR